MGQCKNCKWYVPAIYGDDKWGGCSHERVSAGGFTLSCNKAKAPLLMGGGSDGYGDYLTMMPDFGCILFEQF